MMPGVVAQGGVRFAADGPPAWVAEGAFADLDFVNNRFYAGGAAQGIGSILTGYNPAYFDANGLYVAFDGSDAPLAAGALLSDLAAAAANGLTGVFDLNCISGWNGQLFYFYDAATGPTASNLLGPSGSVSSVDLNDFNEILVSVSTGLAASGTNKFAWSLNRSLGGGSWQYACSVNGQTAVTDTASYNYFVDYIATVLGFQLGGYSTSQEIDAYFRRVTFYPVVDPTALPALSA